MKKTLLNTTMLVAIASLTMSGFALAHHPAVDQLDEIGMLETVEANISDMHMEVIGDVTEDMDMMGDMENNAGMEPSNQSTEQTTAAGDPASTMTPVSNSGVTSQPPIPRAGIGNFGATSQRGR